MAPAIISGSSFDGQSTETWSWLKGRGLNGPVPKARPFTDQQVAVQQGLAIAASTVSIIFGLVTIYWFFRMRTLFRHSLIMMLIISDMLKAMWYFVFPLVLYGQTEQRNNPKFCNASGFLLTISLEGADYAVLVIAIHAALGIFSTKTSVGESGLFKYRRLVYAGWILIPGLMASLAFVNPDKAFVSQGTYCYLPVRPVWYRLALGWIPRYLILLIILSTSITIYFYVHHKFKNFNASSTDSSSRNQSKPGSSNLDSKQLQTDATQLTGSSIPTIVASSSGGFSRCTAVETSDADAIEKSSETPPAWENYTFGSPAPMPKLSEDEMSKEKPTLHERLQKIRNKSVASQQTQGSVDEARHIIRALEESEPPPGFDGINLNALELVDSNNQPITTSRLKARHKAIQKQLRYLFVYPIVYFCLWIIPFVQHCRNYDENYSIHPSFTLNITTVVILGLQCAVDCLVFCARERPWRHLNTDDEGRPQTLLRSLKPNFRRERFTSSASEGLSNRPQYHLPRPRNALNISGMPAPKITSRGPALSQASRAAGARAARQRRDAEAAAAREAREKRKAERKKSMARRNGQSRSWWEVEGKRRKDSVMMGTDDGDRRLSLTRTRSPLGSSFSHALESPLRFFGSRSEERANTPQQSSSAVLTQESRGRDDASSPELLRNAGAQSTNHDGLSIENQPLANTRVSEQGHTPVSIDNDGVSPRTSRFLEVPGLEALHEHEGEEAAVSTQAEPLLVANADEVRSKDDNEKQ